MRKRVLVVDDHPAVALALKLYFKRDGRFVVADSAATAGKGCSCCPATTTRCCSTCTCRTSPGCALVRAFRERAGGVPLILYSASDDTAEVEAVRGMVDAVARKSEVADAIAALERLTR